MRFTMLKTILLAGRILRKNPGFTAIAVVTIALGVGASTAIFSVTNAVLLRPLPYKDPGQLVVAGMDMTKRHVQGLQFSNADYIDLREGTKSVFSDMAGAFTFRNVIVREDGTPEQIRTGVVTTNFFQLMGARILYGRDFTADDGTPAPPPPAGAAPDAAAQPPQMAILSYEYFMRRFGGNRNVIGHSLQTQGPGGPMIVGVAEPGFRLYFPPESNEEEAPDLWVANRLAYDAAQRNGFSIRPIGRLKDGLTVKRAQEAADAVAAEGRRTIPMDASIGYQISMEPMQQHLVAEVRPAILALMGSVIFLLLIACANVANLLLVRASLREQEFAVRAALGASRWRLVVPLLTEACLLAVMGTALGLLLAWAGIRELRALAPTNLPRLDSIHIDGTVLGFTAIAGLMSAVVFGMAPAWRATLPALMNVLRGGGRTSGLASGAAVRNLVVMAEVALSFVLLVGSGLMFRSFLDLQRIDPGFDAHNMLTFQLQFPGNPARRPTGNERAAKVREIKERLSAIAGVQNVTASFPFPLTGDFSPIRWGNIEAAQDPSRYQATDLQMVLPGYFEAMRTPLLAGRTFTEDDNLAGRNNVVIDQILANKAFPGQSAVGKRILIRVRTPEAEPVQIVGVIAHQREEALAVPGREQIYFTDGFLGNGVVRSWALRTGGDPAAFESQVRATLHDINPQFLMTEIATGDEIVHAAQAGTRFSMLLIAAFAVIAGALAGVGLYGVLATAVRQRTAEIGVRMAMGAERGDIVKLVVMQGLKLSGIGIVIGLIAAFVLGRVMTSMLVGVKATDPMTFVAMTVIFLAIAAFASWIPALRAAGMDPKTALHEN
jgi:putative ABC transport system permease protein